MTAMTDLPMSGAVPVHAPAVAAWRALGVDVRLAVTDPAALGAARTILEGDLEDLDLACSRFRPDAEIAALDRADGRPTRVSALLADALEVALRAAADTAGAVDPTLGQAIVALGYDRDFAMLPASRAAVVHVVPRADWRQIHMERAEDGGVVTLPPGVRLDLGATAKAFGADRAAIRIAQELDCGVLVSLGGDIRVAGACPADGWAIRVQDLPGAPEDAPDGPSQTIAIRSGGLATSSTRARRWLAGGIEMHHILDPRSGMPAVSPWRTVSACAADCVSANVASTGAIVAGQEGFGWLSGLGLPARLVSASGEVRTVHGWPA